MCKIPGIGLIWEQNTKEVKVKNYKGVCVKFGIQSQFPLLNRCPLLFQYQRIDVGEPVFGMWLINGHVIAYWTEVEVKVYKLNMVGLPLMKKKIRQKYHGIT